MPRKLICQHCGKTSESSSQSLTDREARIAHLVATGNKNKEIATKLFISEQTVKNHLHNIFDKTGVKGRLELALWVIWQAQSLKTVEEPEEPEAA